MLGLALVAAIASMAFVGASSALAKESTALCNTETLPCGSVFSGHLEALSSKAVLKASGITITCTKSKVLGEALGLAKPQITHVSELTFESCDGTVKVIDKTGLITALKIKLNEAEIEAEGFEVLVEKLGMHCGFGGMANGARWIGGTPGGTPARIFANEVELKKLPGISFFCSGTIKLTATYTFELPKPLYISS
jgi:hypothetical protein